MFVDSKKKKKKKKKQAGEEPSKEAPPLPEKLPEKFFEVSGALKDLLKPVEKKPFSLLSMFGGTHVDDSDVTKKVNGQFQMSVSTVVCCYFDVIHGTF